MKQAVFAGALLMAVIAAAIFHGSAVCAIADEITARLDSCEGFAVSGDWEKAEDMALDALDIWENRKTYVSVTVRKDVSGGISVGLERVLRNTLSKNQDGLNESYGEATILLEELRERERIGILNIF